MNYISICKNGKYYNPASDHYPTSGPSTVVVCDRCQRNNLKVCVGYNDYDLCLKCVEEGTELMGKSGPVTKMEQQQYRSPVHTRMLQGMSRDESPKTYLVQDLYQQEYISLRGGNAGPSQPRGYSREDIQEESSRFHIMTDMEQDKFRNPCTGNSVYRHRIDPKDFVKYDDCVTLMESPRFDLDSE